MRVHTDDEVYRLRAVFLGPRGWTLPWTARYVAYGVFAVAFLLVVVVERVLRIGVGQPPLMEVVLAAVLTVQVMNRVDHDESVRGLAQSVLADLRLRPLPQERPCRQTVRIRREETL